MRITLWPPDWTLIAAIAAFVLASLAAQSFRELAVLVALTLLLVVPVKWLGVAAGLSAFAADAVTFARDGKTFALHGEATAAVLTSIILAAALMIGWRHVKLTRQAAIEQPRRD